MVSGSCFEPEVATTEDYILIARRTNVAEILDAATLETVARIHFEFKVERLSAGAHGTELVVAGFDQGGVCCTEDKLNLATMKLSHLVQSGTGDYGPALTSPDGRWQVQLKSFRGAALRMHDTESGATHDLTPTELPLDEESCGGNWAAQGVWDSDQFYFYVECPNHPGWLWSVTPGEEELGVGVAVGAFGEMAECRWRWPEYKVLAGTGQHLFLFEAFGGKSERSCESRPPGGAWLVDATTGRLIRQIAPDLYFSAIVPSGSGKQLYGVASGERGWDGPVELLLMDAQDGKISKSRVFDAGVLQITVGQLVGVSTGDATAIAEEVNR